MTIPKKTLEEIKKELQNRKRELILNTKDQLESDMVLDRNEMSDDNDLASSEYFLSFELRLRGREKYLLRKIEDAIERIDNGEYGICENCGEEISLKRLKVRPVTTMCIRCKEEQERQEKGYSED